MIIRPDKRYGKVFDVLIEFKFVKLKDAKLSAEQARDLSEDELCLIPEIAKQMEDGKNRQENTENSLNEGMGTCACKNLWWWHWGLRGYALVPCRTG